MGIKWDKTCKKLRRPKCSTNSNCSYLVHSFIYRVNCMLSCRWECNMMGMLGMVDWTCQPLLYNTSPSGCHMVNTLRRVTADAGFSDICHYRVVFPPWTYWILKWPSWYTFHQSDMFQFVLVYYLPYVSLNVGYTKIFIFSSALPPKTDLLLVSPTWFSLLPPNHPSIASSLILLQYWFYLVDYSIKSP